MKKIPLVVVMGATASGKTALAIDIANKIGGEIVSSDSMQIYKYMDIGTAKPTSSERAECVHHLIDFLEPDSDFSVADYVTLAHQTIKDITDRGKIAVMCGGTGLYIDSVVNDVEFGEMDNDYELRQQLSELAKNEGGEVLLNMLAEFDPVSANRLHKNNTKRIIRAIEFYKMSGIPISEHQEMTKQKESRYNAVKFMIDRERDELYERINKRVDLMIDEGLYQEVKSLYDMGYSPDLNSMQGIGYKELLSCIAGDVTLDEAIEQIKQNSRRYAKRQLTWFRRDKDIIMLKEKDASETAVKIIKENFFG